MNLKILLPFGIFASFRDVSQITVRTPGGSLGLLPHRLDCVAALMPGILSYTMSGNVTSYLAIDAGVLVKKGDEVSISVRRAIGGRLSELHQAVVREYSVLGAQERESRSAVAKMEGGLMGRLAKLQHDR